MTVSPLVVPRSAQPIDPWSGIWIAEDIQLLAHGVRSRSWVDTSLGGVAAGLDTLAFVSDPTSSLLQYGIAWLIEHVRPLTEMLDWLAGDPATITAHTATWHAIANSVRTEAQALAEAVQADVPDWQGPAAVAYRMWSREQQGALHTLADGADTMALITETAAILVAGVRMLVRDAIAIAVSRIIVYTIELLASGLLATPVVIEQVSTTVAACIAKIARWLLPMIASLRRLVPIQHRLAQHAATLEDILRRLTKGTDEATGGAHHYPNLNDPGIQKGPLGPDFRAGTVVDPEGLFNPDERAIANDLAERGYTVHPRLVDQAVDGAPNPDAMIRISPEDPGTVAEFKTLRPAEDGMASADNSTKVCENIKNANRQLRFHGGGDAVIDGRLVDLTEAEARRGYARAVGSAAANGSGLPQRVLIILSDNSILELPDR